jgi:hypothetical protein
MKMANRVATAIERVRANPNLDKLAGGMAITFQEHVAYQHAQVRAHASERLTTEEAHIAYRALGEVYNANNEGWSAGTDLATTVVVTQLMGELML